VRGTIRVEVDDAEHWCVALDRGRLGVSHEAPEAECVVRTDRATLDGMVEGRVNATAALLRGLVQAEGDVELLIYLQRLFPSPPGADDVVAAPAVQGAR
jgi:predicted lipid carrier protein YhbT